MSDLTSQVSIDSNLGVARLGGAEIAIASVDEGVHVLPPAGPVIRPLAFGERTRIVLSAIGSPAARLSLSKGIAHTATVECGESAEAIQQCIALALSGAAVDAPPFGQCTILVAMATGWQPDVISRLPAVEVDYLAMHLAPVKEDSGWNRIVFGQSVDSQESLRDELADNLLRRASISPVDLQADRSVK